MKWSNKHKYKLLKSEDFLCVPTSIYTIIESEKIHKDIEFYDVVNYFNYFLPEEPENKRIINYLVTDSKNDWGAKLEKDTVNNLFEFFTLPLKEEYIPINTLTDWNFTDVIKKNLELNNHILFGFDYSFLYNKQESSVGHVSLITGLDEHELLEIQNPGPINLGIRTFNAYDVYLAIKKKSDGLWIITRTN
jgi:hypothetical protein